MEPQHALESLGLLATTNSGGAGKWAPEHSETLPGRSVIIIPDADAPGRRHAVAADLLRVGCRVAIVELPQAKDVAEWIAGGGTRAGLQALFKEYATKGLAEWCVRWGLDTEAANGSATKEERQRQANAEPPGGWHQAGSNTGEAPKSRTPPRIIRGTELMLKKTNPATFCY